MATFVDLQSQIIEHYANFPLPEVKSYFEQNYGFVASDNQWKKKIKQWGLKKNVRKTEYKAMIRKKKERGPGKDSSFKLRGKDVRPDKLTRFEKALAIRGSSPQIDGVTPPGLQCLSPENYQDLIEVSSRQPSPIRTSLEYSSRSSPFMSEPSIENLQMMYQESQSPVPRRGPALSLFSWWGSFSEFRELVLLRNPESPNIGLRNILLSFASSLNKYEEQKEIEAFIPTALEAVEQITCEYCLPSRIVYECRALIIKEQQTQQTRAEEESTVRIELLEKAALASITKITQMWLKNENDIWEIWWTTIVMSDIYMTRGKLLEAKRLLDATILDINASTKCMKSLKNCRRHATLNLAEYYLRVRETDKAAQLLKALIGPMYVSIVINVLNLFTTDCCCPSHYSERIQIVWKKVRDGGLLGFNRNERSRWRKEEDFKFLVAAALTFKRALVFVDCLDITNCGWRCIAEEEFLLMKG